MRVLDFERGTVRSMHLLRDEIGIQVYSISHTAAVTYVLALYPLRILNVFVRVKLNVQSVVFKTYSSIIFGP